MYICQMIYQKLSMFNNFELKGSITAEQTAGVADLVI
jgi:hypothetical protein